LAVNDCKPEPNLHFPPLKYPVKSCQLRGNNNPWGRKLPRQNSKGFLALEMENYSKIMFVSFCIFMFLLKQKIERKYIF
jgi:hypothetical protein